MLHTVATVESAFNYAVSNNGMHDHTAHAIATALNFTDVLRSRFHSILHLNGWVSALHVVAESRGRSVAVKQDSREEVRLWAKRRAWTPHHLHQVVLETMVSIVIVVTPKE